MKPKSASFAVQTLLALLAVSASASTNHVIFCWDDPVGVRGYVQAFATHSPWSAQTPAIEIGPDAVVRVAFDRVFVLSRSAGTLTIIDPNTWAIEQSFALSPATPLLDVAVSDPHTAFLVQDAAAQLIRIDLTTGQTEASTNLMQIDFFQTHGGTPQVGTMILDGEHLIVQLRGQYDPYPAFVNHLQKLVVVDVTTQQLIDVEPGRPGIQAIELGGEYPDFKMEIVPETRQLVVSATGGIANPFGGLEVVDLNTLQSLGVRVSEFDDLSSDIDCFAMVTDDWGWLVFSTDIVLSSHLAPFSLSGTSPPVGPGLGYETLFFLVPDIVHDPISDRFFWPEPNGFHVFVASTGERLTSEKVSLSGIPTDVALLPVSDAVPMVSLPWALLLCALLTFTALALPRNKWSGWGRVASD